MYIHAEVLKSNFVYFYQILELYIVYFSMLLFKGFTNCVYTFIYLLYINMSLLSS